MDKLPEKFVELKTLRWRQRSSSSCSQCSFLTHSVGSSRRQTGTSGRRRQAASHLVSAGHTVAVAASRRTVSMEDYIQIYWYTSSVVSRLSTVRSCAVWRPGGGERDWTNDPTSVRPTMSHVRTRDGATADALIHILQNTVIQVYSCNTNSYTI